MTFSASCCLSFDVDWAAEFMIEELRAALAATELPFTLFCTHDSPAVRELLALDGCEVALHPNFLGADDVEQTLTALHRTFPRATGLRSHALYYSSRLLPLLHRAGLRYLSNDLLFLRAEIAPRYDWSGIARLPIYWEDDVHCTYFDRRFELDTLGLERPGLKVFNFHPVHLFLNTCDMIRYQRVKQRLRDERGARDSRMAGPGVRTLFEQLLAAVERRRWVTLGEVDLAFRRQQRYSGHYRRYLERLEET